MVLGIVLLYGGGIQFLAAVNGFPGDRAILDLHGGKPVTYETVQDGLRSRLASTTYTDTAKRRLDIATLFLAKSGMQSQNAWARNQSISAARDNLVKSLGLGPTNPYAWTQLTAIELALSGPSSRVNRLFETSILAAPVEERLGGWRVAFGLTNRTWLTETNQAHLKRQIRLLAALKPDLLAKIANHQGASNEIAEYLESLGITFTPVDNQSN